MSTKFYIDTCGPNKEDMLKAIEFAVNIVKNDSTIKRVVFYSYTKTNFNLVASICGDNVIKKMFTTGFKYSNIDVLFKCETKRTYVKNFSMIDKSDLVIACHLDTDELFVLDDCSSVKYIVAIPWIMESSLKWINRWNANEITGKNTFNNQSEQQEKTVLDVALKEMDIRMFQTKCLCHSSDIETCKTYIRIIHKYLPEVDSEELENNLVLKQNWSALNAKEAGKLLSRLKEGRTFRGGEKKGYSSYISRWKQKLENKK